MRTPPYRPRHTMSAPALFDPAWTQEEKDDWAAAGLQLYRETKRNGSGNGNGSREAAPVGLIRVSAPAPSVASVAAVAGDEPLPLFPPLPPAAPYPIDALGDLSRAAKAIARKVQVPPAIAAQSVLAVAALAAQAHADVLLPFGQTRPLSLYFATVIGSGDRKSSADNEACWPVVTREKALREAYQLDLKGWKIANAAWCAEELWQILGDGVNQAAALASLASSIPSRNVTPAMIFGN